MLLEKPPPLVMAAPVSMLHTTSSSFPDSPNTSCEAPTAVTYCDVAG